jgi:hypothetical protein
LCINLCDFSAGKFYLVDSGYPNSPGYLAPYKSTRYHVPEWRQGAGPQGKNEVFNFHHASLRNVIERTFGVLKMKWRILLELTSFPEKKQSKIIMACMALHNFIRQSGFMDELFDICDRDETFDPNDEETSGTSSRPSSAIPDEDEQMNEFREWIANGLYARN